MTLNELKLAAKRLRKQGPALFGAEASNLSHAQALELMARLNGFRDYHEAQQRLSQRSLLDELLRESGGLLPTQGIAHNLADLVLATHGVLHVEGPSGSGKSMLSTELVVQALARGRPVRVIDMGGSYRRMTQMFEGEYFSGAPSTQAYAAWASEASLVTLDAWESSAVPNFDFKQLQQLPAHALVIVDESWSFHQVFQPIPAQTCVLIGQASKDFPQQSVNRLLFQRGAHPERHWYWESADHFIELRLHVGPRRLAAYTTRGEHLAALGRHCDPKKMEAFVAALKPALQPRQP